MCTETVVNKTINTTRINATKDEIHLSEPMIFSFISIDSGGYYTLISWCGLRTQGVDF